MDTPKPSELPKQLFERMDNSPDSDFYVQPRLVTHIDDATIAALTDFYREFLPSGADLIDLMSSWISHLPPEMAFGEVFGLGMNEEELAKNPRLTEHCVHDLNATPVLPCASNRFDRALLVVSIQYLTQPVAVLTDVLRTLRNRGRLCIAMSHRMFPTKAIKAFHTLNATDRVALVRRYLELAGYTDIEFVDASPAAPADPLWLLLATKGP